MPIIKKHQTLADFVAQRSGTMNAMFDVALLNGIGISDLVAPGTELEVNTEADNTDPKVIEYYEASKLDIASELAVDSNRPGGIDYMQIENDFRVS